MSFPTADSRFTEAVPAKSMDSTAWSNKPSAPDGLQRPSSTATSEHVVHIRDHSTRVVDSGGDGTPLILLHALAMDSALWNFGVFDFLASFHPAGDNNLLNRRRRVIAYDLRGHGFARDAPAIESLAQLADDLNDLLGALKLDKVNVAGVSFGGAVAQTFVLRYPPRVRSAAFIATTSTGSKIISGRASRAETDGSVAPQIGETISRWFSRESIVGNAECVQYAKRRLENTSVRNWACAWRAMGAIDCLGRLDEIKVPVLILAGSGDTSTTPETMRKMFEICRKGAEYREVQEGMHLFVMESPRLTAAELNAFLQGVDG